MKWYPDPEHIHCIQSCEVRVQTAKHSCIKCASMCKYFSSNISLTQDSETVKRVNVCFSCNHTVPDQRIEYSLLQLRKPKLRCFLYVTDLMFLMQWEEKKWVAACTFYILDLVVTVIRSCPLVFIHADSMSTTQCNWSPRHFVNMVLELVPPFWGESAMVFLHNMSSMCSFKASRSGGSQFGFHLIIINDVLLYVEIGNT